MSIYNPDVWEVLELSTPEDGAVRKVFAGWYGGYAGSDSWKLSSMINKVIETETHYEFLCESGSTYKCNKQSQKMSMYMMSIYSGWIEAAEKEGTLKIEVVRDKLT
jgi:hypothetical protein